MLVCSVSSAPHWAGGFQAGCWAGRWDLQCTAWLPCEPSYAVSLSLSPAPAHFAPVRSLGRPPTDKMCLSAGQRHQSAAASQAVMFCVLSLTLSSALLASAARTPDYKPRKLTVDEVEQHDGSNYQYLPLARLLQPANQTERESFSAGPQQPEPELNFVPVGTNKEKGVVDAIRMPGTFWCGKGWRADGPGSMGGYAGADRCCRQHDLGCPISIEPGQSKVRPTAYPRASHHPLCCSTAWPTAGSTLWCTAPVTRGSAPASRWRAPPPRTLSATFSSTWRTFPASCSQLRRWAARPGPPGPECDRYCAGLHQPELVGPLHAAGGEAVRSLAGAAPLLKLMLNIPAESDAIRPRSTIHGRRAEPEEVGVKSTNSSIDKLIFYAVK